MPAHMIFHRYEHFSALSDAVISAWLRLLDSAVLSGTSSHFALAGGSTPAPLYHQFDQQLSTYPTGEIYFIATDERWVADTDAQSNEGLFKQCMPLSYLKKWQLISLKNHAATPEIAVQEINARINKELPSKFNAVLLGMGTDGHIASLFPHAPIQHTDRACFAALHPQTKQARMSLSLERLLATEKIWLIITGAEKLHVLDSALKTQLPISTLLQKATCDIDVFWCP